MNSKTLLFTLFLFISNLIYSQVNPNEVYVKGYTRSNGTIVEPHYRTAPNATNIDNFTTRPNINPHTLEPGKLNPDSNLNGVNSLISVPINETPSTSYNSDYYYLKIENLKNENSYETDKLLEKIRNQTNSYNSKTYSESDYLTNEENKNNQYINSSLDSSFSHIDSVYSNSSSEVNPKVEQIHSTQNEYDKSIDSMSNYESKNSSSIFPIILCVLFVILIFKRILE